MLNFEFVGMSKENIAIRLFFIPFCSFLLTFPQLESACSALCIVDKAIVVACMDQSVHSYHVKVCIANKF
jgi:hypothetical protein